MPDTDIAQVSSAPAPTPSPAPAASSAPAPAPSPSPAPVPTGDDGGFTSIRDHVAGLGLQDLASQYRDDESFVNFLVQQHRNAQQAAQLTPYAQRYLAHAQAFEQFLSQQAQQQQAQQPQKKSWWSPPEYNPSWERFVTRDDQGNFALVPGSGATPDIIPKVAAYQQYVRDFVTRFTNNPTEALTPLIQEVVQPLLEKHLQQQMGSYQESASVRDFLRGNTNWLYQLGPNNVPLRNHDGTMVLSENGQLFAQLVHEAETQLGLTTAQQQQLYAARVLSAAGRYGVPGGQTQQQAAASQNDQLKQQFLHRPNPAGAIGLNSPSAQPVANDAGMSLADKLRRNLASEGVTDATLKDDLR